MYELIRPSETESVSFHFVMPFSQTSWKEIPKYAFHFAFFDG